MTAETRKGRSHAGPLRGLSPLGELVRRHDRDRYQTALFAPADRREALFALYAFNYEIARVRESVTQPMLGQIRLQWWREVIEAAYSGQPPRRHEVAEPLTAAMREFGLSREPFDRIIDSREADFMEEPPADMAALEGYAEGSSAALIQLAVEVLGVGEKDCGRFANGTPTLTLLRLRGRGQWDRASTGATLPRERGRAGWGAADTAAVDVGIGYALAGLLRAMAFHARSGRCYIPNDLASETGLEPRDYAATRATPALRRSVSRIAETAASHLAAARLLRAEVPRAALPALLPAVIAERAIVRLRRAGWDPFDPRLSAPDTLQSWRLTIAALRGRF